jgi:phage terminase large subunit
MAGKPKKPRKPLEKRKAALKQPFAQLPPSLDIRKVGRPSKYDPSFCDLVIELGAQGKSKAQLAASIGVSRETIDLWAKVHPEFSDALKFAKDLALAWWEDQTLSQRSLDLLIPTFRSKSELSFAWNSVKPTDPVEKLFGENKNDPDFCSVHVTFRDNPWFPEELRRDMERDKRRDPDKYEHIWLGGYLKSSEARVFRNWRVGSRDEFTDRVDRYYFGGDFGFAIDPTVLVRNYIKGRTLYIDREVYLVGCEVDHTPFLWGGCEDEELIQLNAQAYASLSPAKKAAWKGIPGSRKWPIIADSARPETISYLQRHGFPNVRGAKKGANSVVEGVEFLKGYDIVVHPDCVHTIDELTMYSFKTDPLTGEVLPVLVDTKNHVIDANRYAVEPLRRATGGLF